MKVDSLSRLIDSSAHKYRVQQDSIVKYQDSAYKSEVNKAIQRSAEKEQIEKNGRQQTYVRVVLSVLLFLIAIIALMRRRKSKP